MVNPNSDALQTWRDAHEAYASAAAEVLAKSRQDNHELDVVEALLRQTRRALEDYRVARGERGSDTSEES